MLLTGLHRTRHRPVTGVNSVDGTFELVQRSLGAPRAAGPTGDEVGDGRALRATVVGLIERHAATHAAIAFDSVGVPRSALGDGRCAHHSVRVVTTATARRVRSG